MLYEDYNYVAFVHYVVFQFSMGILLIHILCFDAMEYECQIKLCVYWTPPLTIAYLPT